MGQNSRRRRADKQRRRAHQQHQRRAHPPIGTPSAQQLLVDLIRAPGHLHAALRAGFAHCPAAEQIAALEWEFVYATGHLVGSGWTPVDLAALARRRSTERRGRYLLGLVAAHTDAHQSVDERWRAQLAECEARRTSLVPAHGWDVFADELIDLLGVLFPLPRLEIVLPAPGVAGWSTGAGIDEKILRRVRGLLAKAESTEFPAEAEALSAKAQELMSQHSIERALAEQGSPQARPATRRLWLDALYVVPKALLVSAVAGANHCRSVISEALGFVTLIGFDTDLDVVELVTTSLLVQASRAMSLAGRSGASRSRSFRQSFLVAYAERIGERLREAAQRVESDADSATGGALVPVLAARTEAVDASFGKAFPRLAERRVSVGNASGYGAGRAAADLATLHTRDSLGA